MGKKVAKKVFRIKQKDYFEEYPAASRAAERFAAENKSKRASAEIFEITTQDTETKFYQVIFEWDDHERAKKANLKRSRRALRAKTHTKRSRSLLHGRAPRSYRERKKESSP